MGNSLGCPCSTSSDQEGVVIIMSGNGSLIKAKRGSQAKEVAGAHPGHKLIRCGSDRSVLGDSTPLETSRLYFLVPDDLAECRDTYQRFWRIGELRGLIPAKNTKGDDSGNNNNLTNLSDHDVKGQALVADSSDQLKRSPWKPELKTVPEVTSPNSGDLVVKASPDKPER